MLEETRSIERLQFFNGQRLFAADLQGLEAFNREMRWLHNRSLHQAGIGNGFAVVGKKGEREVTIMPGYAIDAEGREIVLTTTRIEPVPPVANDGTGKPVLYDLAVSYPDDDELEEVETRDGVCLPRGVVRLREQPVFCWIRVDGNGPAQLQKDIQDGVRLVLARAEVLNCQLNQPLSIAQRRSARPARLPYVAGGRTQITWPDFSWEVSAQSPTVVLPLNDQTLPLRVEVNTGAAGFIALPQYSAHIEGTRLHTSSGITYFVDGLINIAEPQADKFQLEVALLVWGFAMESTITIDQDTLQDWEIVWMGVES
jgi:hypothetical protein